MNDLDWSRLTADERYVLRALAIGTEPRTVRWVMQFLKHPGVRDADAKPPNESAVRLALSSLAGRDWVIERGYQRGNWTLAAAQATAVLNATLTSCALPQLRDALEFADGSLRPGMHWLTMEPARARLRLESLGGASIKQMLTAFAGHMPWRVDDVEGFVVGTVFDVLDEDLYRRLDVSLQRAVLQIGLENLCSVWRSTVALPVADLAASLLARDAHNDTAMLRYAMADYLFLADRADEIDAVFAALDVPAEAPWWRLRDAYRGALAFRRGDWIEAAATLGDANRQLRKLLERRKNVLPPVLATTFVQALIAQGGEASLREALKFCQAETGRKEPWLDHPLGIYALAIRMQLGETPRQARVFEPSHDAASVGVSPLDLPRWLMRAWLKQGTDPERLTARDAQAAQRLQETLQQAGLAALATQLEQALRVLAAEAPSATFFIGAPRADWQHALDALAGIAGAAAGDDEASQTRLWWILKIDAHGGVNDVVPMEQKRGARGWGKPKAVSLSRIHKAAASLPVHDAAVARAIGPGAYGMGLRVNLAAAAMSLVGHPQVSFDEVNLQAVQLSEAAPELDVIVEDEQLRVRMVPAWRAAGEPFASQWALSESHQREKEKLQLVTVLRDAPQRARIVQLSPEQKRVAQLLGAQGLQVPKQGVAQLQKVLQGLGAHFSIQADDVQTAAASREVVSDSRLRAELTPIDDGLRVRLLVAPYGEGHAEAARVAPGLGRARLVAALDGETLGVQRDLALERRHLGDVLDLCPMLGEPPPEGPFEWLVESPEAALALVETLHAHHAIAGLDWPRGRPMRVSSAAVSQLAVKVRTHEDWLGVQGELQVDEALVVSLAQLIGFASSSRSRYMPIGDGRFLSLTRELRDRIDDLAAVTEYASNRGARTLDELRLPAMAAPWLQEALRDTNAKFDAGFAARLQRLDQARALLPAMPPTLQAELRTYQEEGFEWAMRLAHAGLGACLADDMGLGKTLQALAVLCARAAMGPALVVMPTSLLGNWRDEADRYAPTLRVHLYADGGAALRAETIERMRPNDVLLVSYPMLQIDGEAFTKLTWTTLVLDEAQAIKNAAAKRSQAVFELKAQFRMALSGTPIENRLDELWSIMQACNPGLLGTRRRFGERFVALIERQGDRQAHRVLKRLIAPFVLRRTKAQVLHDLPPRTEQIWRVAGDEAERAHYEALRREALVNAQRALDGESRGQAHLNILAGLTRLRRAACDPRLVTPGFTTHGAKVRAFAELAADLVANGHKALVFSQFVDFLNILREPLDAAGIAYQYLDGSTPSAERTRRVDAFQRGEGDLFLISLKAGGFGLNLTVADYVVIADPWWNPAAEDQAAGRAHRIGQQRPVTVYRLVNEGTLEERILALHATKRELADSVLDADEGARSNALPDAAELMALMREEALPQDGGGPEDLT